MLTGERSGGIDSANPAGPRDASRPKWAMENISYVANLCDHERRFPAARRILPYQLQRTMKPTAFVRVRHGLLVLAASLGLVFGLSAAPAQAAPNLYYLATVEIRAEHSGQCLEVADWSKTNGAAVRQWPCTGGDNQKWHRYPLADGESYFYVNANSGKCLEIGGWATHNGATANQWDCHWGLNQTFYGQFGFVMNPISYAYNKCLEIADWSQQAGARARLWTCTGGANQSFSIRAV